MHARQARPLIRNHTTKFMHAPQARSLINTAEVPLPAEGLSVKLSPLHIHVDIVAACSTWIHLWSPTCVHVGLLAMKFALSGLSQDNTASSMFQQLC